MVVEIVLLPAERRGLPALPVVCPQLSVHSTPRLKSRDSDVLFSLFIFLPRRDSVPHANR